MLETLQIVGIIIAAGILTLLALLLLAWAAQEIEVRRQIRRMRGPLVLLVAGSLALSGCTALDILAGKWRDGPAIVKPPAPPPNVGGDPPLPPVDDPPPPGGDDGAARDSIDPKLVTWDDPASPASWPITATIYGARLTPDGVAVDRITGTEGWPRRQDGGEKPTIGNWTLVTRCADGELHAASIEWYGPGKTRVTGKHWNGEDGIRGCIGSEYKGTGEAWLLVSGCVRQGADCGRERSGIVRLR